jgi:hypothetical protein
MPDNPSEAGYHSMLHISVAHEQANKKLLEDARDQVCDSL